MPKPRPARSLLVTGAAGYLGRLLVERMAGAGSLETLIALDVRAVPPPERRPGVHYVREDVRSEQLASLLADHRVDTVAHLAFVVDELGRDREHEYAVDVLGTRNVLDACAAAGVPKLLVTSSGAAYGYHADHPARLTEDAPLRGNEAFAYSHHKRLVEELLARHRRSHPELAQLVLRLCAVLGARTANPITALFEKPALLDVAGARRGFCFVWDEDVVDCLVLGVETDAAGVYNVAADGELTVREIAAMLGRPRLVVPAPLLRAAFALGKRVGLTRYGPEQVVFLRHRPVLDNRRLKAELGWKPRLASSEQVFRAFLQARGRARAG